MTKECIQLYFMCFKTGSCWYGPVPGFQTGSWWGIRMDCSRDRVHIPFNADIHEGPFGIISVCTSHTNMKDDVDFGNFLTLTGQIYHEEKSKVDFFIYNYKNKIPLRLIRSYNLQNNIAPNTGYRYDGLYVVIGCWIGVTSNGTKYNKYALMRLANQELPSWSVKLSENTWSMQHHSSNAYNLKTDACNTNSICKKRQRDCNSENLSVTIPIIDNNKKFISESSIVTRHVFKKSASNIDSAISVSVSDQKTLTCLGVTKTHSTNISIRTGLYESAHNAPEMKKSVSTMLHKSFKQNDVALRTTSEVNSGRLISRESSKFIGKINIDNADQSLDTDVLSTDNSNGSVSLNNKHKRKLCSEAIHWLENSLPSSSSLNSPVNDIIDCKKECKEQLSTIQKSNNETLRNSAILNESNPKYYDTWKITSNPISLQNVKSFESLTPDKILNLINKEKHHPLSKLLIGNVIGLTVEELTKSSASEVSGPNVESEISPKINLRKICKGKDNVKENVVCLNNRRYCKYSKSKRLSLKVKKQTDEFNNMQLGVERQSCNNQKRNINTRRSDRNAISEGNSLLSFRVGQTSLQTIAKNTRSSCNIKTRLRTDRDTLIAKQKFSNSSIKKNRYKKQDREIANLSIDANFGPITRGPRNRRLRYKASMYTNKRYYSTFNAVIYPPKKRHNFKRKTKLTKVTREKNAKGTYRVSNIMHTTGKNINNSIKKRKTFCNTNENESNNNIGDRKRENRTVVSIDNISKTSLDRSLRKKIMRTHQSAQTSRLNNHFHKKQMKRSNVADATTQCRLTSDPEVYIIGQLDDQRTILKMEWDKLSKFKSESICGIVLNNPEIYQNPRLCFTSAKDSACNDEHVNSLQDRPSAFVPVNTSNSNLRIARLRSIGFKPIIKPRSPIHDTEIIRHDLIIMDKKTKQDVTEKCNDEDNVVYAEDILQYQDIEKEDEESALIANILMKSTPKGIEDEALFLLPSCKNLESPWHGWKKIETDKHSYWIGW